MTIPFRHISVMFRRSDHNLRTTDLKGEGIDKKYAIFKVFTPEFHEF